MPPPLPAKSQPGAHAKVVYLPAALALVQPADEARRLAALALLQGLDPSAWRVFGAVTAGMQARFRVPIVLVNLVGESEIFIKAHAGFQAASLERRGSLCGHVVASAEMLVIEDAAADSTFCRNSLVTGSMGLRFYAGAPLFAGPDRQPVGTLCLIDSRPRSLPPGDRKLLAAMAASVSAMLCLPDAPELAISMALAADEAVVVVQGDASNALIQANGHFFGLTNFAVDALHGLQLNHLLCLDRPHAGALVLRHALQAQLPVSGITRCRTAGGAAVPVQAFLFPLAHTGPAAPRMLVLLCPHFDAAMDDCVLSLKESDRKELLALHLDGLWALDAHGRILELSGKPLQHYPALMASDLLGRCIDASGVFEPFATDWRPFCQSLAQGEAPKAIECCVKNQNSGEFYWYRMHGFKVAAADGDDIGFCGGFLDITEQKRTHGELAQSEKKFRALTYLSSDWYWQTDTQGRFVQVEACGSDKAFALASALIGQKPWRTAFLQATPAQWRQQLRRFKNRQPFKEFELQLVSVPGMPRRLAVNGAPVFSPEARFLGYRGVGRNINEHKQQERVQQSKTRLGEVLKGSRDAAWDWNLETGQCYLSPRWWDMLGFAPDALPVSLDAWQQLIHPNDIKKVNASFERAVRSGAKTYQSEFRMLHREGHYLPVLGRGCIVRNASGKAVRTSGANMDLTGLRQVDEQLRLSDARWSLPALTLTSKDWTVHHARLHQVFADFETARPSPSGLVKWTLVSGHRRYGMGGKFIGYDGIAHDVTAKKQLDRDLHQPQFGLRLMVPGSIDGAWHWNLVDKTFFLSDKGWEILGYAPDEMTIESNTWPRLIHPADQAGLWSMFTGLFKNDVIYFHREFRAIHKNGCVVPILHRGTVVRSSSGHVLRIVGAFTDLTSQRQTEAQIRLLESCMQSVHDVVLITHAEPLDAPGPIIVYVNDAFERFTGYSRQEAIGKSPRLLQGPQTSRAELDRISKALRQWRPVRSELANYKKNGELFWVELDIVPVQVSGGDTFTHWICVQRDITARKQAEQVLRLTTERLAMALHASNVGMWVCYPVTQKRYQDERWCAMLGYTADCMGNGMDEWLELVHPEDRLKLNAQFGKTLEQTDEFIEEEFRMHHKEGHWVWIQSRGKVIERNEAGWPSCIAGTHMDVTQRVQAQHQASQRQLQLVQCLEKMVVGVAVTKEGQVRFANSALIKMAGYENLQQVIGKPISIALDKETMLQVLERRGQLLAGQDVPSFWVNIRRRDGMQVRMLSSISLIEWGQEQHILATLSHVDDASLLAIEIDAARVRYERLLIGQLEERQIHIARELHDSLGSQLAGISLQAAGIMLHGAANPRLAHDMERLLANVTMAAEITRTLARGLVPVDASPGSFWRSLERLCDDYQYIDGIECGFEMVGDFENVPAETGNHLYRICQEAITNALRHGRARRIDIRLMREGHQASMSISDDGTGFDFSATTAQAPKGMGLNSMEARARAIGAELRFGRLSLKGACVVVHMKNFDDLKLPSFCAHLSG